MNGPNVIFLRTIVACVFLDWLKLDVDPSKLECVLCMARVFLGLKQSFAGNARLLFCFNKLAEAICGKKLFVAVLFQKWLQQLFVDNVFCF